MKRYFGIDKLLDENSAEEIWNRANEQLAQGHLRVQGILEKFRVVAVCTTADPVHTLKHHERIRNAGLVTALFPTFRPDRALHSENLSSFSDCTDQLSLAATTNIAKYY